MKALTTALLITTATMLQAQTDTVQIDTNLQKEVKVIIDYLAKYQAEVQKKQRELELIIMSAKGVEPKIFRGFLPGYKALVFEKPKKE